MRSIVRVSLAVELACVAFLPFTALGQNLPPAFVPRPPDPACQNALTAASQANGSFAADSLKTLLINVSPCHPEFGRAIGFLIRAIAANGSDEQLTVAFSHSQPLVDSAIFAAVRDVAAAASSNEGARVFSLMTLFHYLDRGPQPLYQGFVSQVRGATSCSHGGGSDDARSTSIGDYSPLPASAAAESRAVAVAIQQQAGASAALLSASYCVLEAWRQVNGLPSNAHWAFTTASLAADYVCGNRFRIRNQHTSPIALQWQVGSLPRKTVLIPPGSAQVPGERLLDVGLNGSLQIFLDGELIFTRTNGGSPCS